MEEIINTLEVLKGAWPTIQPAISTAFGALVASLFLRGNTSKSEIEKIKQVKFSEVADKLLEDGHITHLEYYKCRNFNKIAQKADEIYYQQKGLVLSAKPDTDSEESKISMDWFVRFFEDAGNISDEQMQELWAKVLAGEIKQPGSFSLRTLDVLKNLSKDEAETLQTIASYAIQIGDSYYICIDKDLKDKYDYKKKLLVMYDCNIVENDIASYYSMTKQTSGLFMKVGSLVCISHNQNPEKYSLDLQRFTKTGNEFIRFILPNEEYLLDFFRYLNLKSPNLKITVHHIITEDKDNVTYNTSSII